MKSKRLYAIIVAATITLSSTHTVLAADMSASKVVYSTVSSDKTAPLDNSADEQNAKVTKDEAKEIAKKVLKDKFATEIDEKKYQTSVYFRPNYEYNQQGYIWDISWNQIVNQRSSNIGVSIDAINGKVIRVSLSDYSDEQGSIASITEDKAKELSDAFLKKINPEEFKQVQLLKNKNYSMYYYSPVNYNFTYVRMVNGVKFDGNTLSVDVNGTTGKIIGYYYRWTDNLNLSSAEGVIGVAKAEEAFKKQIKLNLNYVSYRDKYSTEQDEKSVKLIYTPDPSFGQLLDAKEGKMLADNGSAAPSIITKEMAPYEKEAFYRNLKPLPALDKEIDKNKATEIIVRELKDLYGEGYEIESLNYSDSENNYGFASSKVWSAYFRKTRASDSQIIESGQIIVDALTGGVVNLYKYNNLPYEPGKVEVNYSWEQMYSKAVAALGKYYPDKAKDVNTTLEYINYENAQKEKYYPGTYTSYHFQRIVNGIAFRDNSIDVSFNPITGELTELRCSWDNKLSFPELKDILPAGEESRIYFSANKPELVYAMMYTGEKENKPQYETRLVYRLNNSIAQSSGASIDAFSGKFLNDNMEEIDDNIDKFKNKIKGNAIEKELTILAAQGVIDTKTFEVNNKVTKMELIKMLVNARGYRPGILKEAAKLNFSSIAVAGDANYKYLQMAVYYGIIENKEGKVDLNAAVTREEMAKTLVKMVGYEKLAKAKDIFVINSADAKEITADNKGYIAIAKGLGIVTVTQNKIRPKATATMGELALGVYKVLGNLRNTYY